jgi:hypothetical protein
VPLGELCPVDGDELDAVDADELEDVAAACVDVVVALAEPPVDASATPATPPPAAAAIAAVTMSRRMRPAVLDAIRLLLRSARRAAAVALRSMRNSLRGQTAKKPERLSQRAMSG